MISENSWETQTLKSPKQEHKQNFMFILLKSHLGRLSSGLEHLRMLALRYLLTPQTSSYSWPWIYIGAQRRSSTVCVGAGVMMRTCHCQRDTFLQHLVFFPTVPFYRTKKLKFKMQANQHTLGLEGKRADWSCDLARQGKKCTACY